MKKEEKICSLSKIRQLNITTKTNQLCPFQMYYKLKAKLHIKVKYSVRLKIVLWAKECTLY